MAGLSAYIAPKILDAISRAATTGLPAAWSCNLSLGTPTSVSSSEIATGSGISRQSCSFVAAAAASPGGTNSNATAMTWGPSSGAGTFIGIDVFDTTVTGGNMIYYGTLTTARVFGAGDSLVVAAGSLIVTLG